MISTRDHRRESGGRPPLPGAPIHPIRRTARYWLARGFCWLIARGLTRLRVEGLDRYPRGPAVLAFNHLNWADPFFLIAALPGRPRLYFFGPKEEDMARGARNRLMSWVGTAVPYKPGRNDLLDATRRVSTIFAAGGVMGIAAEGRIHLGERSLLPLTEGGAFFALRASVPIVPVAINGTSWLAFGRLVRVRIGEPIAAEGRADRRTMAALTQRVAAALREMVADAPEPPPPGPLFRRLTDVFNDWPEGSRDAAVAAAAAPAGTDAAGSAG